MSPKNKYQQTSLLDLSFREISDGTGLILLLGYLIYGAFQLFAGEWILLNPGDLWMPNADIAEAFARIWWLFAWGAGITFAAGLLPVIKGLPRQYEPNEILTKGFWISLHAGLIEEILFRWFGFFVAMVVIHFVNVVGYGLVEFFYAWVLLPIANWATRGALEVQLLNRPEWIVGAAIITANGRFRSTHRRNGRFSYISSWFIGMVLFWLVFNYGLLSAILAHIGYNATVFATCAFTTAFQPEKAVNPSNHDPQPSTPAHQDHSPEG